MVIRLVIWFIVHLVVLLFVALNWHNQVKIIGLFFDYSLSINVVFFLGYFLGMALSIALWIEWYSNKKLRNKLIDLEKRLKEQGEELSRYTYDEERKTKKNRFLAIFRKRN